MDGRQRIFADRVGQHHRGIMDCAPSARRCENEDPDRLDACGRGNERRRGWTRFHQALTASLAIVAPPAPAAEIPLDQRKSGYEFMGRETRAMQDDDTANP